MFQLKYVYLAALTFWVNLKVWANFWQPGNLFFETTIVLQCMIKKSVLLYFVLEHIFQIKLWKFGLCVYEWGFLEQETKPHRE